MVWHAIEGGMGLDEAAMGLRFGLLIGRLERRDTELRLGRQHRP